MFAMRMATRLRLPELLPILVDEPVGDAATVPQAPDELPSLSELWDRDDSVSSYMVLLPNRLE